VTQAAEHPREEVPDRRLVVDDEDATPDGGSRAGRGRHRRRAGSVDLARPVEQLVHDAPGATGLFDEQVGLLVEVVGEARIGPDQVAERDDRREPVAQLVAELGLSLGRRRFGPLLIHAGILRPGPARSDAHGGLP
jgi:hypothetical protein